MFHYDDGIKITALQLAIDFCRRQPRAFVSHAHADHMAAHEWALCSPPTARLYQRRYPRGLVRSLDFQVDWMWDDHRLRLLPAGHMLGAAMLWVESPRGSLLYSGDFKLSGSRTTPPAAPCRADQLIIESTFGDPRYRWPPREELEAQLVQIARQALQVERPPVIFAYASGKAQEVTCILAAAGIVVRQHPKIDQISQIYEEFGCSVPRGRPYEGRLEPGEALVLPPAGHRVERLPLPRDCTTIAVTGWALDPRARFRLGVDYSVPLSDHADYDELLELVRQVSPRIVWCTHGPVEFVERLRGLGIQARRVESARGA